MKIKMKKLTALILCLVMSVTFAACGSGERETSTSIPTDTSSLDDGLRFEHEEQTEKESESVTFVDSVPETDEALGVAYDVSDVVEAVMPAMVSITMKKTESASGGLFGGVVEYEQEYSGSGIVVAQDSDYLYIVTNHHVVDDAKAITVSFCDGETYDATVKGSRVDYDLAVLLVDIDAMNSETIAAVRIARLGNSETLRLGEGAVAIGNALGYGQSVTIGCVSALDRTVETEDGVSVPLIQTDAAINPGNSGGALLNLRGEVIGINSMKYASTEVEGMGYAIPVSDALPIMQQLINEKIYDESERGYLGVSGTPVSLNNGRVNGLYITRVGAGSPAATAGVQKYDILISANGQKILSLEDLSAVLSRLTSGDTVSLILLRESNGEYRQVELTATLSLRPAM